MTGSQATPKSNRGLPRTNLGHLWGDSHVTLLLLFSFSFFFLFLLKNYLYFFIKNNMCHQFINASLALISGIYTLLFYFREDKKKVYYFY
jgi:hypothetical protein